MASYPYPYLYFVTYELSGTQNGQRQKDYKALRYALFHKLKGGRVTRARWFVKSEITYPCDLGKKIKEYSDEYLAGNPEKGYNENVYIEEGYIEDKYISEGYAKMESDLIRNTKNAGIPHGAIRRGIDKLIISKIAWTKIEEVFDCVCVEGMFKKEIIDWLKKPSARGKDWIEATRLLNG